MIFRRTRSFRPIALLIGIAVASGLLTAASVAFEEPQAAQAASKPKFRAGAIITDPLFYDFGTMSASKIQSFLNKQVKKCSSKSEAPCLRNYKVSTTNIAAIPGRCDNNIVGKKNQTAAQIIYAVAVACEVNPQVLLVTLQKEQGLITAKSVKSLKYRKAMGYGCPDSSNCNSNYYGFFKQVYWAARAYNAYYNFPGNFKQPWQTLAIQYSPNKKCGTTNVYIETRATAALYNYTPYTPNASSLAHPYKTGNSCSSYGNRNFWLYFNKWFGDTSRGQYFVKSGSSIYVVANGARWKLPAGSKRLVSSLSGLGTTGAVSTRYLKSLADEGSLGPVVRVLGDTENWYLLANAKKYKLVGCSAVQNLGFDCDTPVLPKAVLSKLPLANDLKTVTTAHVRTADGRNFLLGGGVRRQILDGASAKAAGIVLGTRIDLDSSVIGGIPVGDPIVRPGSLVQSSTGAGSYVTDDGATTYTIDASLFTQAAAATWFGGVDGTLDASSIARLPGRTTLPAIFQTNGVSYLIAARGTFAVSDPNEWLATVPVLDNAIAAKIPSAGAATFSAPVLLTRASNAATTFLIEGTKRHTVATTADRTAIATALSISSKPQPVPSIVIATVSAANTVVAPGSVVKSSAKGSTWLVDGFGSRVAVSATQSKEFVGSKGARVVSAAVLQGYPAASGTALPGVTCGGSSYLAISGILRKVTAEDAAQYGPAFGFRAVDATTCSTLSHAGSVGTLLSYNGSYYLAENGHRRLLSSAEYDEAVASGQSARAVSKYFLTLLTPAA